METPECVMEQSNNISDSCTFSRASTCSRYPSSGNSVKRRNREKPSCSYTLPSGGPHFSKLPKEIITQIFSFLSFDQIAQLRSVCRAFDDVGQRMLNKGFYKLGELHSKASKKIKAQLPRRESERRMHHLALYGDILTGMETRLNLLSMTYGKFIDRKLCCFIPGRVIDEVRRIIRYVYKDVDAKLCLSAKAVKESTRERNFSNEHHDVLQELRDLSSMAMEHFEECIQPRLQTKMPDRISGGITDSLIADIGVGSDTVLGFTPGFRIATGSLAAPHTVSIYQSVGDHSRQIARLEKKTRELERIDREKDQKLQELNDRLASTTASLTKLIGKYTELEKQLAELRGEDSGETPTNRETRQKKRAGADGSCEPPSRPKKSRRCKM